MSHDQIVRVERSVTGVYLDDPLGLLQTSDPKDDLNMISTIFHMLYLRSHMA